MSLGAVAVPTRRAVIGSSICERSAHSAHGYAGAHTTSCKSKRQSLVADCPPLRQRFELHTCVLCSTPPNLPVGLVNERSQISTGVSPGSMSGTANLLQELAEKLGGPKRVDLTSTRV